MSKSEYRLELDGTERTVVPCKALQGVRAIALMAKHVKYLVPVFRTIEGFDKAKVDYFDLGVQIIVALQPALEEVADDVFEILSLLSGIEKDFLENSVDFTDLPSVIRAIAETNDIGKLFGAAARRAVAA